LQGGFIRGKGPGGTFDAELVGTGKPVNGDLYSEIIAVVPNKKYTFSVWADPSGFAVGRPILMVVNTNRNIGYGPQFHFSGAAGRFAGTVTIPKDVTNVRVDVSCAGGTIAKGRKFKVSQPVFTPAQ